MCLKVNDPVLCQRFASVVVRIWLGGFRHKCLDDESCLGALILSEIYIYRGFMHDFGLYVHELYVIRLVMIIG